MELLSFFFIVNKRLNVLLSGTRLNVLLSGTLSFFYCEFEISVCDSGVSKGGQRGQLPPPDTTRAGPIYILNNNLNTSFADIFTEANRNMNELFGQEIKKPNN